jgi:glycosyltransferase involved in cell wall biosynthesis
MSGNVPIEGKLARQAATLLVPAYNEAGVIADSLAALTQHLSEALARYEWELLVVDDGSTDDTARSVDAFAAESPLPVRLLRHDVNRGLGAALRTAFRASRGRVVVTVDADLSYSVDHIERLVSAWESDRAAVVVASPYAPGGRTVAVPSSLEIRSRLANQYLKLVTRSPIHTFTGFVRAYDGDFARSVVLTADGPTVNVEVLRVALAAGARVTEIPATLDWTHLAERRGRSRVVSGRALRETRRVLREGLRFRTVGSGTPEVVPVRPTVGEAPRRVAGRPLSVIDLTEPQGNVAAPDSIRTQSA